MDLKNIFMAFFRVGILGYGGGPSSIPLIKKEVVDRYKWMTDDEFSDVLAIGNALPGPIATKLAGYIGNKVSGIWGLLVALIATVIPTVLIMIFCLGIISTYREKSWVRGMTEAVIPVVAVMLATMTWDFINKSQKSLGWMKAIIIIAVSILALVVIEIPTAIYITSVLILSLIWPVPKNNERNLAGKEQA